MADEKKSPGEIWGPFEVLVIVLLIIGFLSQFQNPSSSSPKTQVSKTTVIKGSDPVVINEMSWCGLSVSRPRPLEKIGEKVILNGKTEGCNWLGGDEIALFAQIIDAKGETLSAYTAINASSVDENQVYFYKEIYLLKKPKTSSGYLILVPAQNPSHETKTARIPLKFK